MGETKRDREVAVELQPLTVRADIRSVVPWLERSSARFPAATRSRVAARAVLAVAVLVATIAVP